MKRKALLADWQHAGRITRTRKVCFQGAYPEMPVFGSVDSHHFRLVVVFVAVFFTLTDRVSTIPSNIRGCQSGGLLDRKRSEKHLQSSNESTPTKQKRQNKGTITQSTCQKKIEEGRSIERGWYSTSREPSSQRLSISLCSCVYAGTHSIVSQISPSPCDICSLLLS